MDFLRGKVIFLATGCYSRDYEYVNEQDIKAMLLALNVMLLAIEVMLLYPKSNASAEGGAEMLKTTLNLLR